MKLFQIGHTQVRVHPGLFVVLLAAVVLGMLGRMLQAMLALTLHETFHAIVARSMGYRVDAVEFLPFGGVARLEGRPLSPNAEFWIAAAGPLCSFVVAGAMAIAISLYPVTRYALQYFLNINLALALFNLLPALPLDGGSMLRAILLHVLRPRTATLIAAWIGVAAGAALLLFAAYMLMLGYLNPFVLMMGVFLLLAAVRELRAAPQAQLNAMLRRKDAFSRGEALPMRHMAVRASLSAGAALRQLSVSRYNLLLVLDEDMEVIGHLDEGRLLNGIARKGQDATVGELLRR
jgi:stage IV sporulation protein FB